MYHCIDCFIHEYLPFIHLSPVLLRFLAASWTKQDVLRTSSKLHSAWRKIPLELAFLGGFGLEDSDFVCGLVSEFAQRLPQHVSYTSTD